jgi:hypothetical protein
LFGFDVNEAFSGDGLRFGPVTEGLRVLDNKEHVDDLFRFEGGTVGPASHGLNVLPELRLRVGPKKKNAMRVRVILSEQFVLGDDLAATAFSVVTRQAGSGESGASGDGTERFFLIEGGFNLSADRRAADGTSLAAGKVGHAGILARGVPFF